MDEEWTTRKVTNHKTKQVETRIQRQIVMEDGKVIADSGPQITTRTKEDNKVEESESKSKKLNTDKAINNDSDAGKITLVISDGESVIKEKIEKHNVTREAKQECIQYHDESIQELSGFDIHQKAVVSPNDLITLTVNGVEKANDGEQFIPPPGKLAHFSSKSQRITDKEEIKEVSKMGQNGEIVSETTRTHHHEEVDDDEKPDDNGPIITLPEASGETLRKIEFANNYENPRKLKKKSIITVETDDDHTNKWIESHFGSSTKGNDSTYSKCRTRAGGNKIVIELTGEDSGLSTLDRKRQSNRPFISSTSDLSNPRIDKSCHKHITSNNHNYMSSYGSLSSINRSSLQDYENSLLNRSNGLKNVGLIKNAAGDLLIVRNLRRKVFKEDASVQASLSDEESSEEDFRQIYQANKGRHGKAKSDLRKPLKTYYFGENPSNDSSSGLGSSSKDSSPDRRKGVTRTIPIENHGYRYDDQESLSKISIASQKLMMEDRLARELMLKQQLYRSNGKPLDCQNDFINKIPSSRNTIKDCLYDRLDLNGNGSVRSKDDLYLTPRDVARMRNSLIAGSRLGSSNCLCDRLYRSDFDDRSSTISRFTGYERISPLKENRLRNRKLSLILQSPSKESAKFPEFSPLLSPTEIKNATLNAKNGNSRLDTYKFNYDNSYLSSKY